MTKVLKTLIKISRQELDEKRHNLNIFLEKIDEMEAERVSLEESLISEQKYAEASMDARYAYNAFAAAVRMKQENIDNALIALHEQRDIIEEEIRIKFAELKKFEILLENKEAEIKKEIDDKSRIELDEIAITQYNNEASGI